MPKGGPVLLTGFGGRGHPATEGTHPQLMILIHLNAEDRIITYTCFIIIPGSETPDEYQGDLLGDVNRRRGRIVNIEAKANASLLHAEVPLAELFGYATAIRSLSKGRAAYSMEPLQFDPVPASVVAGILDTSTKPKPQRS